MVEDKEIILAIVGASIGLGGIVLVFLGFALRELDELLGSSEQGAYALRIRVLRGVVLLAGLVTMLGIATSGTGMGWLMGRTGFYDATTTMFFVTLGLTVALTFGAALQAIL